MLHIHLKVIKHTIRLAYISLDPFDGAKRSCNIFFFFSVMLHIKLRGKGPRTPCKQILCSFTHLLVTRSDSRNEIVLAPKTCLKMLD